jgi:MFS transporter, DHA2 family, multidrug resistance protein
VNAYPDPTTRTLITVPTMVASTMVAVDITIANVALPHMQASLSASMDQILWVLTSYIVAGAIATPLGGWLAVRFGRKPIMLLSIAGFTFASALCGLSTNIAMIVAARILQGVCGAALVPLSQAILLDINPPENHAKAMAIFAMGAMVGPIFGPTMGGYLTDNISWRWVFFINVPVGIAAFAGIAIFMPENRPSGKVRFDVFGFLTISMAIAAIQLFMDRGEQADWFDSTEIIVYAVTFFAAIYLFAVHTATARDSFIRPKMFADRNFTLGVICSFMVGMVIMGSNPLMVVMTQSLYGHTALQTGVIGLPRAIGSIVSSLLVIRLVKRYDARYVLIAGILLSAWATYLYASLNLYSDDGALLFANLIQGFGSGLLFVPLSLMVFATLPAHLRDEGSAMYSLIRSIGNSIGISVLQYNLVHYTLFAKARLGENIHYGNVMLELGRPGTDVYSADGLRQLAGEVDRQAAMIGYVEVYTLCVALTVIIIPLVLLFSLPKPNK